MNGDIEAEVVELGVMPTYSLNSWMKDLHPLIKSLKLGKLSLAGAHNAGMDKKASYSNSYITCQDDSFHYQLNSGVRALDIRLRWFHGYGADNVNRGLICDHDLTSGRTFANLLNDVDRFHEANPGEIIILAFHQIEPNSSNNPVPYAAIHAHFMRHYTGKMLPRSAVALTLEQIKVQYPGPRFIVAVPSEVCGDSRDNTYFWNKIQHKWAGSGLVSSERLFSFIGGVMMAPPVSDVPWSLSATTYGILGPGDIVDQLRNRFPAGGDWQRKSSIINFDWCARSGAAMIRQCIESNVFKTNLLAITSPLAGATYFNGASSVKGAGMPGATITLYDTGAGWYDAGRVSAEGVWEARLDLHPVSNHPLKARQKFNGVESDWSEAVIFNVVSHIPVPKVLMPVHGLEVRDVRPLIFGDNGVPGATVRFYEAGSGVVLYGTAVVGLDGKWGSETTVALPAGQFSLTCDQFGSGWQSDYSVVTKFTVNPPRPQINVAVEL
ncbi:hypothetical protein [Pseudomonas sp. NFX224]|uniref:hypothetical protein n=1 Tax=Pseudomonas sp. NFX224 TaxID=3402862 RepID=UPI003AFB04D6